MRHWAWLILVAVAAWGCSPTASPEANSASNVPARDTPGGNEPTAESKEIPSALLTEGAQYIGLGNLQTLVYKSTTNETDNGEGTMSYRVSEVKDGEAIIEVTRDGSLAVMGSETMALKPDGLYTVTLGLGELDKPLLQAPADLAPGKKWESSATVKQPTGATLKMSQTFEAKTVEKVKVTAGEFDAIKVVATLTIEQTDATGKVTKSTGEATAWFSKGVGLVKQVINLAGPQKQVITVELIRQGS
jgi:hypothetical protein